MQRICAGSACRIEAVYPLLMRRHEADLRKGGEGLMRISTMKGIAAGSLVGVTLGAGLMMTPQGKRMKRVIAKNGPMMFRQLADCWTK